MSNKNISKLLAFTAIAGAAIAAGIAYFKHKNADSFDDDFDDDFDDEDFDFPLPTENDTNTVKREYVSLNLDSDNAKVEEPSALDESKSEDVTESTTDGESVNEDIIA